MPPEANQGANPAAAARAAAFDREVFREALLAKTMNQTTSARAAILPTNEPLVQTSRATSRPMTDRPVTKNLEPTTPRTQLLERALRNMGQLPTSSAFTSQNFVHSSDVLTFGEGPEGHPIRRVPERKWFLRNEASARVKNTEYCASFCRDNPREQLDEMLNMTYNDRGIQRATKVDIAQYPRNELRTALMGWGPRMRQIYVPELKAHTQELHERYLALGLPHEYHGDAQASSPVADKKGSLLQPRTAPATGSRRPGIKDLQDAGERSEMTPGQPASPDRGSLSSSLQSASFRPDGSANAAATEYRGQFCKNLSMQGTLERTQMFMDGAIDFDAPSQLEQTKRAIRVRHAQESHVVNNYKQMVYTKEEARRNNISVDDAYMRDRFKVANDPYGLQRNSTKRHRPPPINAQESPRIPNIATLQKDLEWKPPGILQSLTGKAGPSEVTSHRTGYYGIQQAHSPRQTLRWGDTRTDRRPHYVLEINVEGKHLGFPKPDRYSDENNPKFARRSSAGKSVADPKLKAALKKPTSSGGVEILKKPSRE